MPRRAGHHRSARRVYLRTVTEGVRHLIDLRLPL